MRRQDQGGMGAETAPGLLARRIRSLSDVELDDPAADRAAVAALVARHAAGTMPPAALAVSPAAFAHLLELLPPQPDRPHPLRRTVSLAAGGLAATLEAALPCLQRGAAELQLVMPAEAFAPDEDGEGDPAFGLLRELKLACGPHVPLKVLLQGAAFAQDEMLAEAVETALLGGADMIGLDLESLGLPAGPEAALDAALRLTALLAEAERPVGLKFRGGRRLLAGLDEAVPLLRLAGRFLDSRLPDASQLRFAGPALDDAVLALLRREREGGG